MIINLPNGYIAVLVSNEAEKIKSIPLSNKGWLTWWEGTGTNMHFDYPIKLIGILNEDLKEEEAREIAPKILNNSDEPAFELFYKRSIDDRFCTSDPFESLQSFIESKGGILKNPYEKPVFDYGFPEDGPSESMLESAQYDYEERIKIWESSENELQKAIIIKKEE